MTDEIQIKDLPAAGSANLSDLFAVQRAGVMRFLTGQQLLDLLAEQLIDGAPGALDTLNELAAALGDDANFAATITTALAGKLARDGSNFADDAEKTTFRNALKLMAHGQCRLVLDAGVLKLNRYNGRFITINGKPEEIPASPPSLAATGLTSGTLYYIYAYMNAGVMTLEASATSHALDVATGIEIKSGDATRTLVGMARPVAGPAFGDSITKRFVRSWFNRVPVSLRNSFAGQRTTVSTSWVEVNSEIRAEFLSWADETADLGLQSPVQVNVAGVRLGTALTIDGVSVNLAWSSEILPDGTGIYFVALRRSEYGLSEGYHYATLAGIVSSGTGTWRDGLTASSRATITGTIHAGGQ